MELAVAAAMHKPNLALLGLANRRLCHGHHRRDPYPVAN
jgi:hypothetical protein